MAGFSSMFLFPKQPFSRYCWRTINRQLRKTQISCSFTTKAQEVMEIWSFMEKRIPHCLELDEFFFIYRYYHNWDAKTSSPFTELSAMCDDVLLVFINAITTG